MHKVTLTSLFLIFLLASSVSASPFLICDPQAGVETYEVYRDGVLVAADIPAQPDGSIRYDLAAETPGQYAYTAKACNMWGCSSLSDPFQSPAVVSAPSGLGMVK